MERLKLKHVKTLGKGEHGFNYAPLSGVKFNFYKRKIKMMNNENGRSMVEMLGVLAIIGVLSVAGIAGYSMAMRKYRANEIAQAISTTAILAKTANGGTGITEGKTYTQLTNAASTPGNASITANGTSANGFSGTVDVTVADNDLCKAVESLIGTTNTNPLHVSTPCGNGTQLTVTVK